MLCCMIYLSIYAQVGVVYRCRSICPATTSIDFKDNVTQSLRPIGLEIYSVVRYERQLTIHDGVDRSYSLADVSFVFVQSATLFYIFFCVCTIGLSPWYPD